MPVDAREPGQSVGGASPAPGGRLLVIEDEADVAELIRYNLAKEGYDVQLARNGMDGFSLAKQSRPDLILVDLMVPQLNGWEICRRLKRDSDTREVPVIIVTGRVEEGDKVLGFEMGADDYVTKPFSIRELLARGRAVMRRGAPDGGADRKVHLKAGQLEIDRRRFEVTIAGRRVELTLKEFELCRCWWARRAGSSAARSCSTSFGATTGSSNPEPSMCIWPGCAPSSLRSTRRCRGSRPSGESVTGSAPPNDTDERCLHGRNTFVIEMSPSAPILERESDMKRSVVLAAVLLVIGALVTPAPAQTLMNGAGATFPYPLYAKWFEEYTRVDPEVRFNYQSIGSGGGIRQITERTVDFGATDGPMTDEQLTKAPGKLLHIPTVLGAVVATYNLPAAPKLQFTGEVLADIFLGKITKWNDERIKALNTSVNLPNQPIVVVHRSDGSGTTYIWVDYLAKVSKEWEQKVGLGTSVNWPVGLGGKGNEGVAGQVKNVPGALG
jgi:DNA-binding response OmpR family regulator